jgi:hypothetical protein
MSLLSSTEIEYLTGEFYKHFDTFATDLSRNITIYKEPKKVITLTTGINYPGYGNTQNATNITYVVQSGVYPALILYNRNQDQKNLYEANVVIPKGQVQIKVKEDAKNYIKLGKTESIIVDGNTYNTITDEAVQNYLGLTYYYFTLERVN